MLLKHKRFLAWMVVCMIIFTLIPFEAIEVVAEELTQESSLVVESNTLNDNMLMQGDELIVAFNENISPSDNFDLIQLVKHIDETEAKVEGRGTTTISKLPLAIEVGIKEKEIKIKPSSEEYNAGFTYTLTIPRKSISGTNSLLLEHIEYTFIVEGSKPDTISSDKEENLNIEIKDSNDNDKVDVPKEELSVINIDEKTDTKAEEVSGVDEEGTPKSDNIQEENIQSDNSIKVDDEKTNDKEVEVKVDENVEVEPIIDDEEEISPTVKEATMETEELAEPETKIDVDTIIEPLKIVSINYNPITGSKPKLKSRDLNIEFNRNIKSVDIKDLAVTKMTGSLDVSEPFEKVDVYNNFMTLTLSRGIYEDKRRYKLDLSSIVFEDVDSNNLSLYFDIFDGLNSMHTFAKQQTAQNSDGKLLFANGNGIINFVLSDYELVNMVEGFIYTYDLDGNEIESVSGGLDNDIYYLNLDPSKYVVGETYELHFRQGFMESNFGHSIDLEKTFQFIVPINDTNSRPTITHTKVYSKSEDNYDYSFVEINHDGYGMSVDIESDKSINGLRIKDDEDNDIAYTYVANSNSSAIILRTAIDMGKIKEIVFDNVIFNVSDETISKSGVYPILEYDIPKPKAIDFSPTMTSYPIDINKFIIHFNKQIGLNQVDGNFYIESDNSKIECNVSLGDDRKSVNIYPKEYLSYGTNYKLKMKDYAVYDNENNSAEEKEFSFFTKQYSGPTFNNVLYDMKTSYKNERDITFNISFEEQINVKDDLNIMIYRETKMGYESIFTGLAVINKSINNNNLRVKIKDYITSDNTYKIEIPIGKIGYETNDTVIYNSCPIILNSYVKDRDKPIPIDRSLRALEDKIEYSMYTGGELKLEFNEDINVTNDKVIYLNNIPSQFDIRTSGNALLLTYNGSLLEDNSNHEIKIDSGALSDASGNSNDEISIRFKTDKPPNSKQIAGKNLEYLNGMIVIEFDEDIAGIGDIGELTFSGNASFPIEKVFYRDNRLYIKPVQLIDLEGEAEKKGIRNKTLYNPNYSGYKSLVNASKDKKYTISKSMKSSFKDDYKYHTSNKFAIKYYLNDYSISIPQGFVRFDSDYPFNKALSCTLSYNIKSSVKSIKYEKKMPWYKPNKDYSKKYEKLSLKYKVIDISSNNPGIFNKSSIPVSSPIEFSSKQNLVWGLEKNISKEDNSFDYEFNSKGSKIITGTLVDSKNTAFNDIRMSVIGLPKLKNLKLSIMDSKKKAIGEGKVLKVSEEIKFNMNLKCSPIALEDKKITITEVRTNKDGTKTSKVLDTVKTNNKGNASYTYSKDNIDEIITSKVLDNVILEFRTEGLLAAVNGNTEIVKTKTFKMIGGNPKAKIYGDIKIYLNNNDFDDDTINNSIAFAVKNYEGKYQLVDGSIDKISRTKDKITLQYTVSDIPYSKGTSMMILYNLSGSSSTSKNGAVFSDLDDWSRVTKKKLAIMAKKINKDFKIKLKENKGYFIEEVSISNRDYDSFTKVFSFIKNIDATENITCEINWKEGKKGLVILKKTDQDFNLINDKGIQGTFDIDGYQSLYEAGKVIKFKFDERDKVYLDKDRDIYSLQEINMNDLEVGEYKILAINSEGQIVTSEHTLKIIKELPDPIDNFAYYISGDYFVGFSLGAGMEMKFPKISNKIPVVGGTEFKIPYDSIFGDGYKDLDNPPPKKDPKAKPTKKEKVQNLIESFPIVATFDNDDMSFNMGFSSGDSFVEEKTKKKDEKKLKNDKVLKKKKFYNAEIAYEYGFSLGVTYNDDKDQWDFKGGATVGVEAGIGWTYYYIVPVAIIPVPVCTSVGASVGVSIDIFVVVDSDTKDITFAYAGSITLGAEIAAGIGVSRLKGELFGAVDVTGNIEGEFKLEKPSGDIEIEAEAGVRLVIDAWLFTKTFKKSLDWDWRKEFGKKSIPRSMMAYDPEEVLEGDAKMLDRYTEKKNLRFALANNSTGNLNNTSYTDTISNYTDQKISTLSTNKIMVAVLDDNLNRPSEDRNSIKYTVYDNNGFSEFKDIDPDATLDSSFDLIDYKDGAIITWTNFSKALSEINSYSDAALINQSEINEELVRNYIQYADINVSIYDSVNDTWSEPFIITNDLTRDYNPHIATYDSTASIIWAKNEDNLLIQNIVSPDELYYSSYDIDMDVWRNPEIINIGEGLLLDYYHAIVDGVEYIVYTLDTDGELITNDDTEIYLIKKENGIFTEPIQLTNNQRHDSNPKLTVSDDKIMLTYKSDTSIMFVSDISEDLPKEEDYSVAFNDYSSGEDYDIVTSLTGETFITWSKIVPKFIEYMDGDKKKVKVDRNVMEVFSSIYDAEEHKWSSPLQVTRDDKFNRYVDTTIYNNKLKLVYSSIELNTDSLIKEINDSKTNVTFAKGFRSSATPMMMTMAKSTANGAIINASFAREHNLTLKHVESSVDNPRSSEEIIITSTIENTGHYKEEIKGLRISYDGSILSDDDYDDTVLMPGDTMMIETLVTMPEYITRGDFEVAIDANDIIDESDEKDNILIIDGPYEDIEILDLEATHNDSLYKTLVQIRNISEINVNKVVIVLENEQGDELDSSIVNIEDGGLEEDESYQIVYEFPDSLLTQDKQKVYIRLYPNDKDALYSYEDNMYLSSSTLDMDTYSFFKDGDNLVCEVVMNRAITEVANNTKTISFKDEEGTPYQVLSVIAGQTLKATIINGANLMKNKNYTLLIPDGYMISNKEQNKEINLDYAVYEAVMPSDTGSNTSHGGDKDTKEKDVIVEEDAITLKDIENHWASTYIKELVKINIISGYEDGTFRPNNAITRAEFLALIIKILGIDLIDGKVFSDTENHWAKEYIATAYEMGIVSGYDDSSFGPNDNINREQMAVMLIKALNSKDINSKVERDSKTFSDSGSISDWANRYIKDAYRLGLINGYEDNSYKPKKNTTRGEAAKVICDFLEKAK